ncbi:MAG TPA: hypothetical protein VFG25_04940 [Nitrosopumilaceae archaeon]|nr:hypothetical protein [Nitrosopumilaceae archaeon]
MSESIVGEQNKEMITLNDLRVCSHCGNVFSKKVGSKITNRCPACNVWKKEKDDMMDLGKHD